MRKSPKVVYTPRITFVRRSTFPTFFQKMGNENTKNRKIDNPQYAYYIIVNPRVPDDFKNTLPTSQGNRRNISLVPPV